MEDKALQTLRTMLGRRGLDTKTDRIIIDDLDRVNIYTVGGIGVIFSQKDSGLTVRDIQTLTINYARVMGGYKNGLIIVSMTPPSENVLKAVKALAEKRVQIFHLRELQFDITTHRMAMPHRILKEEEQQAVFKRYNITDPESLLPWIDSHDPMAKWIGALPGDIIEVTRHSDVAGPQLYYRYCVADVNVA